MFADFQIWFQKTVLLARTFLVILVISIKQIAGFIRFFKLEVG